MQTGKKGAVCPDQFFGKAASCQSPSSSSKMVANLKMMGYVDFEPYGVVRPTKKGWQVGEFLLHRHVVLDEFFHLLNHSDHHLKLVEQIEHYIDRETLDNLEELTKKMMKEI